MAQRIGTQTILLPQGVAIIGSAAVGTPEEAQGPLGQEFTYCFPDATAGESTWEKAESTLHKEAINRALQDAAIPPEQVQLLLAGDLLNQCIGTTFGIRDLQIPFAGMYGACSTMALTLAMGAILTECGVVQTALASTSSHFCSAEKQFRMSLEYGGQRPPTAQWTASAAGAAVLAAQGSAAPEGEAAKASILVQGIADIVLVFPDHLELLDYKTDRRKTEADFLAAYRAQLNLYALAIDKRFAPKKVTYKGIYSLELGKLIEVKG